MTVLSVDARQVAKICGSRFESGPSSLAQGWTIDSRNVKSGDAFLAVGGGSAYVHEALEAGASFAVTSDDSHSPNSRCVVVGDMLNALGKLGAEAISRSSASVVGITGSTGKTLTKDWTAAAVSATKKVWASPQSFNNEIGVPLTVLTMPADTEVLVAELGSRGVGQIADLCSWLNVSVGVITGVGTAHLGEFKTRKAIAEAKGELADAIGPKGLCLVRSDDDFLNVLTSRSRARVQTVGPGGHWAYTADGTVTSLDDSRVQVNLPLTGHALVVNAVFALAVAHHFGVNLIGAALEISRAPSSKWRMEVSVVGGRRIYNDAYNANPTSMAAALKAVAHVEAKRPKVAVLGQMLELGESSDLLHRKIGRLAAALGYQLLISIDAPAIALGAREVGTTDVIELNRPDEFASVNKIPDDAAVLIKASRGASLEGVATTLLAGHSASSSEVVA